jgi:nicotinamidase-related amidase
MPAVNPDFHGGAERSPVALLIIDMINDLDFPGGPKLLRSALPAAEAIRALKRRAAEAEAASIYVNDNFGQWRSDFRQIVEHCGRKGMCGAPLVRALEPGEDDYFVVKPRHSGFFTTTLELLLHALGARTLILTGIAGDICVLFTANDAYMRGFRLVVPPDCVASETAEFNEQALALMERRLKADLRPSPEIDFGDLMKGEAR